jgi:tetratricopeptide (TPR) repeat protein
LVPPLGNAKIGHKYLDEAYKMQKEVFEECHGKHPLIVKTLSGLAKTALMTGLKTEALKQSLKAVEMARELVPESTIFAEALTDLANIQLQNDNEKGANASCNEAIKVWKMALGGSSDHPRMAEILLIQGQVFEAQGKLVEATKEFNEALVILNKAFDNDSEHPLIKKTKMFLNKM